MTTTKHILRMTCGVTVEMTFNEETAQMDCKWTPAPPYSLKKIEKIRKEYEPWRNEIVTAWAQRNKKKVMIVTRAPDCPKHSFGLSY
jgi:DNA gyrase inhibitor GyrI